MISHVILGSPDLSSPHPDYTLQGYQPHYRYAGTTTDLGIDRIA